MNTSPSPSDSTPQSPLKSSLAAIESQNLEVFVVALKDGSPLMTVVQLAQQGSFIRACVTRLSARPGTTPPEAPERS